MIAMLDDDLVDRVAERHPWGFSPRRRIALTDEIVKAIKRDLSEEHQLTLAGER